MGVLRLVTINARARQVFVALSDVTPGALHVFMGPFQRKFGLGMVVGLLLAPRVFAMAPAAIFTKITLMRVILFVAPNACQRRRAIELPRFVTAFAARLPVSPFQFEISLIVIEGLLIELDNIFLPSLVICVAVLALNSHNIGAAAVHALLFHDVFGNVLMAVEA